MPSSATIQRNRDALLARVVSPEDLFHFIPPSLRGKDVLTVAQVALLIGYKTRFVLDELHNGRLAGEVTLEHYGPPNRTRNEWRITMRSALLWMAENWHGNPEGMVARVKEIMRRLDRDALVAMAKFCAEEISRRPLQ